MDYEDDYDPDDLETWRRKGRNIIVTVVTVYGAAALIALGFFYFVGLI